MLSLCVAASLATLSIGERCVLAQEQAPAPAAGRGRAAADAQPARRLTSFPTREKAPQEVLDRGKAQFGISCAFCHGSDAGGGEVGPNLKRSGVVLEDKDGELIEPIVHGARQDMGMPRIDLTSAQVKDIAAWLHSLAVTSRTDPNAEKINIVVGNADAGTQAFQQRCASCHSATNDLQAFGSKFNDPKALQQWWMMPGSGGARGAVARVPQGLHLTPATVTVTGKDGHKIEGKLLRLDDYYVRMQTQDGAKTIDRSTASVVVHDPLQPHKDLLKKLSDNEIHDITAYLVTLK